MRNVLIALTLTSCGTPAYQYAGYRTYEHFPLDGNRAWLYKNQNQDFMMTVEKLPEPSAQGSKRIHTLRYAQEDPYRLMYSIKWSSDSTDGVEIHGYSVEDNPTDDGEEIDDTGVESDSTGGQWVNFIPPLQITEYQMAPGDVVQSSGGGVAYTSTFERMEGCPNDWRDDWDCMKVVISSAAEDEVAPFVGTWHWATRYGASLFQPPGEDYPWTLVRADWTPE
jgi:hypothetical protein